MDENEAVTPLFDAAKRFSDEALRVGQLAVRYETSGSEPARKQAVLAIKSARVALAEVSELLGDGK